VTKAKEMLDTYPRSFNVDAGDSCLSEQDVSPLAKCIRVNLDCADICTATSRVASRQTEYDAGVTRAQLEACAVACESCGVECQRHDHHMAHCKVCAESCQRCGQACRELLAAMA
jgi:hypothetical protein